MKEIDARRRVLEVEKDTLRNLIDHHLGTVDAIARVKKAEERVEEALREWWAQDCREVTP